MYTVVAKERLCSTVSRIEIEAPRIAQKAEPGQFVIYRTFENSERVPLTIAGADRARGTITLIYQIVGASTMELDSLRVGQHLTDLVGPLGRATQTEGLRRVLVVGGGVGCAIAYPVTRKLHEQGATVHVVAGFRNAELVILEEEFHAASGRMILLTDDGSRGQKGLVTDAIEQLLCEGETYDEVIAIGPLLMMKFVCALTRRYGIKTVVSMNPIMIDGTGMCGGCRLTVGGKTQFACVDGPDFDGHLVDFDEAMRRSALYREQEACAREAACRLLRREVE